MGASIILVLKTLVLVLFLLCHLSSMVFRNWFKDMTTTVGYNATGNFDANFFFWRSYTEFQSPAKAVYNARHWNQPEPEEIPTPTLSRSQTAPVGNFLLVLYSFYSSIKFISIIYMQTDGSLFSNRIDLWYFVFKFSNQFLQFFLNNVTITSVCRHWDFKVALNFALPHVTSLTKLNRNLCV